MHYVTQAAQHLSFGLFFDLEETPGSLPKQGTSIYIPMYSIILILGTPKVAPLIMGNPQNPPREMKVWAFALSQEV